MKDKQLVAVDLGFGYIKLFSDIASFKIPSVVGEGNTITFKGFKENKSLDDRLNDLHVKINDKEWFIGNLAIKQESGMFVYDENRLNKEETRAALLSLLALINDHYGEDFPYVLLTGLPISHYRNESLTNSYKKDLLGSHLVTLLDKDNPITRKVIIEQVKVLPQGVGAFFSMLLNVDGSFKQGIKKGNYAIIDQGYRTLDYAVFNSELDFIDKRSGTKEKDLGIKDLLNELLVKIQQKFNEEAYELNEIDMLSVLENRYIVINGKKIVLDTQIEQLYQKQANKIINSLAPIWGRFNFNTIYLAGGIANHLEKHLKRYIKSDNIVVAQGEYDSQFANAEGFLRYGKNALMSAKEE
ncbi:hypothetical protein BHF71_10015 [Vulcanibacillus modesticaldus]|uniref:Uncharacterized protein n=1 Tax=Vulcanibacillus modesticaldus TaxID=337097 RepID=A0A1D2YTX4_9BACI|nr:ParM/StbA family protein [Vulcanibacillus modesticaldus]OEF99160.1 hypothetical protein BHF71_10015 [Vulcanibacillus modesticaldus]